MAKTNKPEQIKEDPIIVERKLHKSMDRLSEGVGGLHATVGSAKLGEEPPIDFFYNSEAPDIKVDTENAKRKLAISFSSVQTDDNRLLHHLFSKAKQS